LATKIFTLDGELDITGYPTLLVKNNNVSLQINQVVNLPGATADHVAVDGLIVECANHTVGTVSYRIYQPIDSNAQETVFSMSRDADASTTGLSVFSDLRTQDYIIVIFQKANATKWRWHSNNNYLDQFIGQQFYFAIVQDGVEPKIYVNGVDITASDGAFIDTTDTTLWFKNSITDVGAKSDSFNLGVTERNNSNIARMIGKLDSFKIRDIALSPAAIAAEAAKDSIAGPETEANLVCHLPFRGNANDVSGQGNHGTLMGATAVVNDPDNGYATTSPEFRIHTAAQEYARDAGEGNYIDGTSFASDEIVPAGTSIKYQYALDDSETFAGVSNWSGSWKSVADLSTDFGNDVTQARRLYLKGQLNEDNGDDKPTMTSFTVNYEIESTGVDRAPILSVGPSVQIDEAIINPLGGSASIYAKRKAA